LLHRFGFVSHDHLILSFVVTVNVKARVVTVKGPKGQLQRDFKHMAVDMNQVEDGKTLKVDIWFGTRENIASLRYALSFLLFSLVIL
jgi:large subunit ribosomal protein L9e